MYIIYEVKVINTPVSGTFCLLLYVFETYMQLSLRRGVLHHLEYSCNYGFKLKSYSDVIFVPVSNDTLRCLLCIMTIIPYLLGALS